MPLPIEITTNARNEYGEIFDWYAERGIELALRLEKEFEEALELIQQFPLASTQVDHVTPRHGLTAFPYNIYYRVEPHALVVVAIVHQSCHPDTWRHENP